MLKSGTGHIGDEQIVVDDVQPVACLEFRAGLLCVKVEETLVGTALRVKILADQLMAGHAVHHVDILAQGNEGQLRFMHAAEEHVLEQLAVAAQRRGSADLLLEFEGAATASQRWRICRLMASRSSWE